MNRKILLVAISYLVGTVGGLYLNKNIILFLYVLLILYLLLSKKSAFKFFIALAMVFSSIISLNRNLVIENIYEQGAVSIRGVIVNIETFDDSTRYTAKIEKCSNKKCCGYSVKFYSKDVFELGDVFIVNGRFEDPDSVHNYRGFSNKNMLVSKGIMGGFQFEEIHIIGKKACFENKVIFNIRNYISESLASCLPKQNAELCKSVILGDKSTLDKNIQNQFSDSSLSHILAISGMHVMYISSIIMLCTASLKKSKAYIINIAFIIFFCILTGSGESVIRATIMICLQLISKILHRNSDSINNLSVALIVQLMRNPFAVHNAGFILSYMGTLGILIFYKKLDNKKQSNKLIAYAHSQIALSISSNLCLIPIIALQYNKVSVSFLISNIVASILLTVIMPLIGLCIFFNYIPLFSSCISFFLYIATEALLKLSSLVSKIKFLSYIVVTPSNIEVIFYYTMVTIFAVILYGTDAQKKTLKKLGFRLMSIWIMCCLIVNLFKGHKIGLDIFFIDVGQGDATLIITESNKKILIDGGGSENDDNYIAERVLFPYLMDRRVSKIDYVIISHFDTDHVRRTSIYHGQIKCEKCCDVFGRAT